MTSLFVFADLASFTTGHTPLHLDILEGLVPGGSPQSAVTMDVEEEPSAFTAEGIQGPPEPATGLSLSTTELVGILPFLLSTFA